jgi:hypothetical protein
VLRVRDARAGLAHPRDVRPGSGCRLVAGPGTPRARAGLRCRSEYAAATTCSHGQGLPRELRHDLAGRPHDRDLQAVEDPHRAQADHDPPAEPRPRQPVEPTRDRGPQDRRSGLTTTVDVLRLAGTHHGFCEPAGPTSTDPAAQPFTRSFDPSTQRRSAEVARGSGRPTGTAHRPQRSGLRRPTPRPGPG